MPCYEKLSTYANSVPWVTSRQWQWQCSEIHSSPKMRRHITIRKNMIIIPFNVSKRENLINLSNLTFPYAPALYVFHSTEGIAGLLINIWRIDTILMFRLSDIGGKLYADCVSDNYNTGVVIKGQITSAWSHQYLVNCAFTPLCPEQNTVKPPRLWKRILLCYLWGWQLKIQDAYPARDSSKIIRWIPITCFSAIN